MGTTAAVFRQIMRVFSLAILLALSLAPSSARADANVYWNGGFVKNYVIDLIFYGNNFSSYDKLDAQAYVINFASYFNGQYNPPGQEPAVHYYGIWGIYPGEIISDSSTPPSSISNTSAAAESLAAENGGGLFGPALDFPGT